jgi:hypothetical protein
MNYNQKCGSLPAVVVIALSGNEGTYKLLILSQWCSVCNYLLP